MKAFDTEHVDNRFVSQRGTVLGVTIPNINPWLTGLTEPEKPKQCLIKLYDENIRAFKLNEVVTFVGHLEFTQPLQTGDEEMKDETDDIKTGVPNERLLPQLHVFTFKRNQCFHLNPVLKTEEATEDLVKVESDLVEETRGKILAVLKMILAGDNLAAEYVLLSLLARVHTRKDAFILGNVSVNITNISFIQARNLAKFISAIMPFSMHLPVTIESLEQKRFCPRKNYDTNLLESGVLQLVDGTFVILDETTMKEGQLKGEGINAIKALATLIEQQVVEYDF
jgi:hypothetical protein